MLPSQALTLEELPFVEGRAVGDAQAGKKLPPDQPVGCREPLYDPVPVPRGDRALVVGAQPAESAHVDFHAGTVIQPDSSPFDADHRVSRRGAEPRETVAEGRAGVCAVQGRV